MPKIETYSGGGGVTGFRQASASDFVDTRGLRSMEKGLAEVSATFQKMRETEDRLLMARTIAEGKQKWMLELDKRQQQVEAGELDYRGFTETFNKDYSSWIDETINQFGNKRQAEELRVNLIEMQSPLMGGAMSFEAQRRAKQMTDNYNSAINPFIISVKEARTPQEIQAAGIGAAEVVGVLPPDLRSKANTDLTIVANERLMEVAETPEEIAAAVESISGVKQEMTPAQVESFMNKSNSELNRIKVKAGQDVTEAISSAGQLAKIGQLQPGWNMDINDRIRSVGLDDSGEYQQLISRIDRVNTVARGIWKMSPMEYDKTIQGLSAQQTASSDVNEQAKLQGEIALYQELWLDKNKALTTDFSGTAMKQSDTVRDYFGRYQAVAQANTSPEEVKKSFERYVLEIDNYANQIKYTGQVNYLPKAEADSIALDMKTTLQKENGVVAMSDKFDSYRQLYGNKFGAVMRQVREVDPTFGALSVIPRIEQNTEVRSAQYAKNEIIRALSIPQIDKKAYDGIDVYKQDYSQHSKMDAALSSLNMVDERSDRRNAYENLAKMYVSQGNDISTAQKKAYKIAYGDVGVYNRIVYPASKKSSISRIVAGAKNLMLNVPDIEPPLLSNADEQDRVIKNISSYVDFVTSPTGNGVVAVWKDYGGGMEPVRRKSGEPIKFSWTEAEAAGVTPTVTEYNFNPVTGGY